MTKRYSEQFKQASLNFAQTHPPARETSCPFNRGQRYSKQDQQSSKYATNRDVSI